MKKQRPPWMFSKWLLLVLLIAACGGIVPPPPKSELKPAVEKTTPESDATGVVLNKSVSVIFNKEMALMTAETFFLEEQQTGGEVQGKITQTGATAVFRPDVNLPGGVTFTATVTGAAEDLFGNPLETPHTWQFTTAQPGPGSTDDDSPTVVSTSPASGAPNVPTNTPITVTFSEDIDPATLIYEDPGKTFEVSGGVKAAIPNNNFLKGNVVTFIPDADLRFGKDYTVTITAGVKDLAGNAMAADFSWSFLTRPEQDTD